MPNNRAFSLVSLSFLFAIFHVEGRLNGQNNQNTVFIIERPDDLTPSPFMNRNESIVPNLKSFAWSSCSGPDALAVINKLELSGPLSIPGNLTLTLNSYLQQSIKSPLKVAVKIYKKISFIWVDVPCLDNVGSCIYEDFCAVIPFTPGKPCPEPLEQLGFPCYCPLPQGAYNADNRSVHIPDEHIPHFLAKGHYSIKIHAFSKEKEIICLNALFDLA